MSGSDIVPFDFEGKAIRVVMNDDEPWWVLADVCRVLDIANAGNAAARLDDDEKGIHTMDTPGGPQSLIIINEFRPLQAGIHEPETGGEAVRQMGHLGRAAVYPAHGVVRHAARPGRDDKRRRASRDA